jgi:hypothetical protein
LYASKALNQRATTRLGKRFEFELQDHLSQTDAEKTLRAAIEPLTKKKDET